jgi:hypothetical protein
MSSSAFPPVLEGEPDVCVPASLIGGAAEILALVGDMAGHDRDGTFRARIEDFMNEIGAEPRAAADWLTGSVRRLAREAEEASPARASKPAGSCPATGAPAGPGSRGKRPSWRRSPRPPRRTTRRPPTSGCAATWPTWG